MIRKKNTSSNKETAQRSDNKKDNAAELSKEEDEDDSYNSKSSSEDDLNYKGGKGEDQSSSDHTGTYGTTSNSNARDEVKELKKVARKDTLRVQLGRCFVVTALIGTAVAIILTTYNHLKNNEIQDYQTAYEQFSRTVVNAAKEQQQTLRQAYKSLAETISAEAMISNATWPLYTLPRFEQYAYNTLTHSRTEVLNVVSIVKAANRARWEAYANDKYGDWVKEGYEIASAREGPNFVDQFIQTGYKPFIWETSGDLSLIPSPNRTNIPFYPSWSFSPPPFTYGLINSDLGAIDQYAAIMKSLIYLRNESLTCAVDKFSGAGALSKDKHQQMHSKLPSSSIEHPHSFVFEPIHIDPDDPQSEVVAAIYAVEAWDASLQRLLPDGVNGIIVVIQNNCNQTYTYTVDGSQAILMGYGDLHESAYDDKKKVVDLSPHTHPEFTKVSGHCMYSMHIYPSSKFEGAYNTNTPKIFVIIVASAFMLVIVVFYIYDMFVQRRNDKIMERTARSNAIVSSLFPSTIRDKLIGENAPTPSRRKSGGSLKTFMSSGVYGEHGKGGVEVTSKPLADLFLETTIMFADIVGFTAWSSTREPSQVFALLETLYGAFDEIANARRVFKVETVGDCYVAATGMPEPRRDHAIAMCRFAKDVMNRMHVLVRELEVTLGPDTGDLSIRIGIHSGPVTAGVLRGERARFQLFGDTMNTTARVESTGMPGRIHLSQETADILTHGGKGHWIEKRSEQVVAKGKGQMQTFWLTSAFHRSKDTGTVSGSSESGSSGGNVVPLVAADEDAQRTARRVDWLVESFVAILKNIVALRNAQATSRSSAHMSATLALEEITQTQKQAFLDEVQEIIRLPEFDKEAASKMQDPAEVKIDSSVVKQLHHYVSCIAKMYRPNSFHNFEHASHVTMSVLKLLSRIIAPTDLEEDDYDSGDEEGAATLHDHTYGITSDPLTQFACAFSSLIHDVDHSGAPNAQLMKEDSAIVALYGERSIAEQNSLALAWDLLMDKRYADLRATIYADEAELHRFRHLVVNSVMATDIVDKELKNLRNARWEKAFKTEQPQNEDDPRDAVNRKATIVIEHLIQASDVAHTMQHWHVYRKWNERFFLECYKAYKDGRAEMDPSENWYKGEIGFYDFYIIPLAKKLKECGVFGKSSDEYLNYAMMNRQEWEARGQEVVAEMVEKVSKLYGVKNPKRVVS